MTPKQLKCPHKHINLFVIGKTTENAYYAQCKDDDCHLFWEWPNDVSYVIKTTCVVCGMQTEKQYDCDSVIRAMLGISLCGSCAGKVRGLI